VIKLTANLQIKRTVFHLDEYKIIREFYSQILAKENDFIPLQKSDSETITAK
jgi:hypothetical protein